MNFQSLLEHHTTAHPQRIALYDEAQPWTYGALAQEVDRLAHLLHEQGARRGDSLALWMPNCVQWLAVFLACARLGIIVVAVNTRFREHEVGQLLERGRCKWLAMWPSFKGLPFAEILAGVNPDTLAQLSGIVGVADLTPIQLGMPGLRIFAYESNPQNLSETLPDPASDADGALIYTTSGTTSASKLVLHRQAGLIAHGHASAAAYGVSDESVVLAAAPFCGAFGFSTAMCALAGGATLVSSPVFNAAQTVGQIREYGVTHTFANNEFIDLLMQQVQGQNLPFPSLKYVGFATFAPSLDDLPERARAAGLPIAGLYGSSELQALVAGQRLDSEWAQRRGAGGLLANPNAKVRAISLETGAVLPHGEIGTLEISAPSIMSEYFGDPEATAKAISEDGFFRTGDLGITLSEHEFSFQGRNGDYLRLGGFLVNPIEIESFVEGLDGVKACQVVGAEFQGRLVPFAFVIAEQDRQISEAEVIDQCKAAMARFKVPQRVVCLEAFPMVQSANSNKIQRPRLQQMAAETLAAERSA